MTDDRFAAARSFLLTEGRLLERRLFATLFEGAPASGVVDALRGYQNDDGGFGHGLEPDKLCPASLPIDVEMAFHALLAAEHPEPALLGRACDWLAAVADDRGAVPLAFPVMEGYPRAEHWAEWTYAYGVHPTAGLAGLLHALGFEHPWRDRATAYAWSAIDDGTAVEGDAHALGEVLLFLEHVPEQERVAEAAQRVAGWLPSVRWFRWDASDPGYGVTPLHYAPTPASRWRSLFDGEQIEGHLDRLERDQQPDGGWPITWEPPGKASVLAYRGIVSLDAVRTLVAYGRWPAPSSQSRRSTSGANSSLLT
ncbi:MAG: hypothetical protein ACLGI2_02020 [Acidimicrobiia bacterium]